MESNTVLLFKPQSDLILHFEFNNEEKFEKLFRLIPQGVHGSEFCQMRQVKENRRMKEYGLLISVPQDGI